MPLASISHQDSAPPRYLMVTVSGFRRFHGCRVWRSLTAALSHVALAGGKSTLTRCHLYLVDGAIDCTVSVVMAHTLTVQGYGLVDDKHLFETAEAPSYNGARSFSTRLWRGLTR